MEISFFFSVAYGIPVFDYQVNWSDQQQQVLISEYLWLFCLLAQLQLVVSAEEQDVIYYNVFYISKHFPLQGFKNILMNII